MLGQKRKGGGSDAIDGREWNLSEPSPGNRRPSRRHPVEESTRPSQGHRQVGREQAWWGRVCRVTGGMRTLETTRFTPAIATQLRSSS